MKIIKFIFYVLLVLGISSCKKDSVPTPKEKVLNKIFRNGVLETEYIYGSGKQLERLNSYNTSTGQLSGYVTFEYDARRLLQRSSSHNASGKITGKRTFIKDTEGKFVSADFQALQGADSGMVVYQNKFKYNAEGHISRKITNYITGTTNSYTTLFFYYPNGNLKRYEFTSSQKQYGFHGYLTSQVFTRRNLLGSKPDVIYEMTYSYLD